MILAGKAHKFSDNINTDYIISGKYKFKTLDMDELAKHVMEDLDPDFYSKVEKGDFIVGGQNFGCGSSREQAPLAIKHANISGVLAKSFARIFFRNAINTGLPVIECNTDKIDENDELIIDMAKGKITNKTKNLTLDVNPLPSVMIEILNDGGLTNYFKKRKGFKLD